MPHSPLSHAEIVRLRTAPKEPTARIEAALRLLDAFEREREKYVNAGDLECLLDEAIAGQPLYDEV